MNRPSGSASNACPAACSSEQSRIARARIAARLSSSVGTAIGMARSELVPRLLELDDPLMLVDLRDGGLAAPLRRVGGHLPFLDASLAIDLAFEQDVAGAQAHQPGHHLVG